MSDNNSTRLSNFLYGGRSVASIISQAERKLANLDARGRRNLEDLLDASTLLCDFTCDLDWDLAIKHIDEFRPSSPDSLWIVFYYGMALWAIYDALLLKTYTDADLVVRVCRICRGMLSENDALRSHVKKGDCVLSHV